MTDEEEKLYDRLETKFGRQLTPVVRRCTVTDAPGLSDYTIQYPDGGQRDHVASCAWPTPLIGDVVRVELIDGSPIITDVIGRGPIKQMTTTSGNANTGSATYVSAGVGSDTITQDLIAGQRVWVHISAKMNHSLDATHGAVMSFKVTGPSVTYGPNDDDGVEQDNLGNATCAKDTLFVASDTGSHQFQLMYKAINGATANFYQRRMTVKE